MKHIIAIFICLIIMLGAVFFQAVETEDLVNGYSNVVELLGKSQLTLTFNLIGERYDGKDDYTGGYMCNADDVTGRDVTYGGCALKDKKIKLKGKIDTVSGNINICIRYGSEKADITVDENGCFDEELEFDSGSNYIMVQYKDFTGSIDMQTEYV